MKFNQTLIIFSSIILCLFLSACEQKQVETDKKLGHELYEKVSIDINTIPGQALAAILQYDETFVAQSAEKESKNSNQYLDIEGKTNSSEEIEFDMLLVDGLWTIVEIQKDIQFDALPVPVQSLYKENFEQVPGRIIESSQTSGEVL